MSVWPPSFWSVLALCALLLHGSWEIGQMNRLYTCWDRWGRLEGVLWMAGAIGGDVVITGTLVGSTAAVSGVQPLPALDPLPAAVLIGLSAAAAVLLEWVARWLDLWRYRPAMPTIPVFGLEVGVAPLVQVSLLPAVAFVITVHFPI